MSEVRSSAALRRTSGLDRPEWFERMDAWDVGDDTTRLGVTFAGRAHDRWDVTVEHERLPDTSAALRARATWKDRLGRLRELLETG
jgi:hypothetical protein